MIDIKMIKDVIFSHDPIANKNKIKGHLIFFLMFVVYKKKAAVWHSIAEQFVCGVADLRLTHSNNVAIINVVIEINLLRVILYTDNEVRMHADNVNRLSVSITKRQQ